MDTPEYTILIGQLDKSTGMWAYSDWVLDFWKKCVSNGESATVVVARYGGRFESAATSFRDVDMIVFATESDMAWFLLEFG